MIEFANCLRRATAVAIAAIALLPIGCNGGRSEAGRGPGRGGPVPVTVASVGRADLPVDIEAIGHVEASANVSITSRVEGQLQKVSVQEGDFVKAGEVLFRIDPRQFQIAVKQAAAKLDKDRVLQAKAKRDVERYHDLVRRDYASHQQYDEFVTTGASLEATVAEDEAALQSAQLQLAYCTIRAPIDGRIGEVLVHAGNMIKADPSRPLLEIRRVRPIYVRFSVPEHYLPRLQNEIDAAKTEPLSVVALPRGTGAKESSGKLDLIDNSVDAATGSIMLRATFDNQDLHLWPRQYVQVTMHLSVERNRIVVPTRAVLQRQQGPFVYVVGPDNKVAVREVKTGRTVGQRTAILSGLQPGETVVTDGQLRLRPGALITHRPEERRAEGPGSSGRAKP